MAKNIEINLNQGGTYEVLYPKISLTNNEGTALPISQTSGSIDIGSRTTGSLATSRLSGSVAKANGGTGTTVTSGGSVFYATTYKGTGEGTVTISHPNFGLTAKFLFVKPYLHVENYENSSGSYKYGTKIFLSDFFILDDTIARLNSIEFTFSDSSRIGVQRVSGSSTPISTITLKSTSIVIKQWATSNGRNFLNIADDLYTVIIGFV